MLPVAPPFHLVYPATEQRVASCNAGIDAGAPSGMLQVHADGSGGTGWYAAGVLMLVPFICTAGSCSGRIKTAYLIFPKVLCFI
jgi:hypothetical protein